MITPAQTRPNRAAFGVMLIIASVLMMSIQDASFKLFSGDLSLWQIFTLRGLCALPLFFMLTRLPGQPRKLWRPSWQKWALLRALFLTLMFIAMYISIPFISLATFAAGIYTSPIFITLMSAFMIGEPVSKRGWLAIMLGFSGVLIVLQPGSDAFSLWAILPLLAGFLYALSNITTRSKCQDIPPAVLAFSLNSALLLAGIVLSGLMLWWQPTAEIVRAHPYLFSSWLDFADMGRVEWGFIAVAAVFVIAIAMGLAGAYQSANPSTIATFDYTYLIFMVLWDYLFFTTTPTQSTLFGILLIIGSGLLVVRRR